MQFLALKFRPTALYDNESKIGQKNAIDFYFRNEILLPV